MLSEIARKRAELEQARAEALQRERESATHDPAAQTGGSQSEAPAESQRPSAP
jgi:hypothetical protein